MNISLIKGHFPQADALDLLTQLVQVKIKYHEDKIGLSQNEEDMKMRERRIKELQHNLHSVRQQILMKDSLCELNADINI